jgi:hypothetical protein
MLCLLAAAFLLDPLNLPLTLIIGFFASTSSVTQSCKVLSSALSGGAKAQLLKLVHENLPDHVFAISSYQSAVTRNVTMRKGVEHTKLAPVHVRKNVWTNVQGDGECVDLAKVATKLLSMHETACASERNWSKWGRLCGKFPSALSLLKGEVMVFIAENDEHSDLRCDEDLLIDAISS